MENYFHEKKSFLKSFGKEKRVENMLRLKDVTDESYFYFVHSYYAVPSDDKIAVGICEYGQDSFAAIVGRKNVFATQFHPEKSQESGLKILRNFIKW